MRRPVADGRTLSPQHALASRRQTGERPAIAEIAETCAEHRFQATIGREVIEDRR